MILLKLLFVTGTFLHQVIQLLHDLGSCCLAFLLSLLGSRAQQHLHLLHQGQGEVPEEVSQEHLEDIPE